jgi:CRP-like cAMP-binding protein
MRHVSPGFRNEVNKSSSSFDFISRNYLLQKYCTQEQKSFLEKKVVCCNYKKDNLIFYEHSPAFDIFFIYSGKIALWKEDAHIRKKIIRFGKEGDFLGYRGSFIGNYTYRLTASALEDSIIYSVAKDVFEKVLKENPELNFNIMLSYLKELEMVESRLHALANMNAREKVAEALLIVREAFADKQSPAPVGEDNTPVSFSICRKELGAVADLCEGKTIKQLSEFRDENILNTCGTRITLLQPGKLKEIVARFHEYSP